MIVEGSQSIKRKTLKCKTNLDFFKIVKKIEIELNIVNKCIRFV